jgi:ABC-type transporter Mla subunit MlaD
MTNDRLSAIEHTLQQLVAGQGVFGKRLDTIDGRLDTIDGRLDRIDGRLDVLDDKVQFITDAQAIAQEHMTKGFKDLREEFNHRLVPLETAVRRLSIATPARKGRPSGPRKGTPRR